MCERGSHSWNSRAKEFVIRKKVSKFHGGQVSCVLCTAPEGYAVC